MSGKGNIPSHGIVCRGLILQKSYAFTKGIIFVITLIFSAKEKKKKHTNNNKTKTNKTQDHYDVLK